MSLRAEVETGLGTVTSISAWQKVDNPQNGSSPVSNLCSAARACFTLEFNYALPKVLSQELVFNSRKFGPVSFIAGRFLYRKDSELPVFPNFGNPVTTPGASALRSHGISRSESPAIFGEVTWDITDDLSVIGGVRYTHDSEAARGRICRSPAPATSCCSIWSASSTSRLALSSPPTSRSANGLPCSAILR